MNRGEAIHRLFSRIKLIENKDQIGELIKPLVEAEYLDDDDYKRLCQFLAREDVFCLFHGDLEVYNERDIAGYVGEWIEYRRVDRLIMTGARVLVIDFKTGSKKTDQHRKQIMDYIHILESLFSGKKIQGYLLYPDLDMVEPVTC